MLSFISFIWLEVQLGQPETPCYVAMLLAQDALRSISYSHLAGYIY